MVTICNAAGERLTTCASDAEAVRWWKLEGLSGDWILETEELLSDLADILDLED